MIAITNFYTIIVKNSTQKQVYFTTFVLLLKILI